MVKLRAFDAFPKVEETYRIHQSQRSPLSYLFILVTILIIYLETSTWIGATPKHRFDVNKGIAETFQVNLQVTVREQCEKIGIYIQDENDDRLFVNELVEAVNVQLNPESDEMWCQVSGIFETNRVNGRIVITPNRPTLDALNFNTSHFIGELSFGEYYPNMLNPLDMTSKIVEEPTTVIYYLSIVPTVYEAFGLSMETNQYTVTERFQKTTSTAPALVFQYDFDPIKITVTDGRMSFFAWLCRAINIIGGVIFAYHGIQRLWGPKKGHNSTPTGLLDKARS